MLEIKNISKYFGPLKAVDQVSFTIPTGEVVGFLGPNGAGKTTTMRMIAGVLEPDEGTITYNGNDVTEKSVAVKAELGYLPENNPVPEDLLVKEAVGYVAELRGLRGQKGSEAINRAIERTGLAGMRMRPIGELSKGYRQRVGLAQAIVADPKLLVLDEPTEGLDPNQRHEIRDLIKSLGRERTVLLSTHVLAEVANTCARVLVIKSGKIVADDSVEHLKLGSSGLQTIRVSAKGEGIEEGLRRIAGVTEVKGIEGKGKEVEGKEKEGWKGFEVTARTESDPRPEIFHMAVSRGWVLQELHEEGRSLEDVFRELTMGN